MLNNYLRSINFLATRINVLRRQNYNEIHYCFRCKNIENFILSFSLTIIIKFLRIQRILKIFQKNITVHVVYQIQA